MHLEHVICESYMLIGKFLFTDGDENTVMYTLRLTLYET